MTAMYCYLWYEKDKPSECKFGERWVKDGQNPTDEIWKRIKTSVGVRKDLVNDGTIVLESIWDVSAYARKFNRFYIHGKVDDHIRVHIGHRKGKTGEVHVLSADQVRIAVNKHLIKFNQPLPFIKLTPYQYMVLDDVIDAFNANKKIIVAELCARFGKTIWSLGVAKEINIPITVVVSYVLTSFTSFIKEISGYGQFSDMAIIDAKHDSYQSQVKHAIAHKKKIIILLSMCNGSERESRLKFIHSRRLPKLFLVDEADYGVHKIRQSSNLIAIIKPADKIIIMTGTNGDRASCTWKIDHYISVTYSELIIDKHENADIQKSPNIKHFEVDICRRNFVVDVHFYQMNIKKILENSKIKNDELFVEDCQFLPSWAKFAAYPLKAKGFFINMLQSIFEGKHNADAINIDYQASTVGSMPNSVNTELRVAMMFFPGNTTNIALESIEYCAKNALSNYEIIRLSGKNGTTNATAENKTKEMIQCATLNNKNVLILSANMAQRSFSIGEITELYLAYDGGDCGATIQKMSRALTPKCSGKIGKVISLSFDPNRDDKFDLLLLETAQNYQKKHKIDLKAALFRVLKTVDIFECTESGASLIDPDYFMEHMLARNSIDRMIGKIAEVDKLSADDINQILANSKNANHGADSEEIEASLHGKTKIAKELCIAQPNSNLKKSKNIEEIKKIITNVSKNLHILRHQTTGTFRESLELMNCMDSNYKIHLSDDLGMDCDLFYSLYNSGIFNQDFISLKYD